MTTDLFPIDEDFLFSLLKEMITIDSTLGNESALAYFLADEAEKLGLQTSFDLVAPNRENLYASHSFSSNGPVLTFNGHSDTVEVCEGWSTDPFTPIEKDGKLFGLGSADQKAGLACQLSAIKALIESDVPLSGTIHYSAVVDEEGFGTGAKQMIKNKQFGTGQTSGVIISEPIFGDSPDNPLALGMTGKVLYKITVKGSSAHAFRPELGINAVSDAAKIIVAIQAIMDNESKAFKGFSLTKDDDFEYGSFCVLKVDGGYKTYSVVVPEMCEIVLNRLIVPGETKETVLEDFQKLIKSLELNSKVNLEIVPPFYYSYKISQDHLLNQLLIESYQEIFNKKPKSSYLKMITDANTFMGEAGIPTILFGPKGANLHAANEYVVIDTLLPTAKMYCNLFYKFQQKKN